MGRLISVNDGKDETKYTYNYEGLRITKETGNKKVLYIYDGKNLLLELDSLGNVSARNVFGTKLISREITGNLKGFYRYNGHGDVVKIVDKSGKVLVEYYYDAFGSLKESTGNFDNPYRYSGYIYDEEAKYYYLQSRMYDPLLGRFIQEDSYRGDEKDPLSLNLYTYCLNNPMIYDDQNGHWPSFLSKIGSAVSNAWNGVKSFVSNAWNGVKSFVSNAWNGVKSFVSNVWNGAKSVVKNVVSWGKQKYNNVKRVVNNVVRKVSQNKYVKATVSAAQRAYNYTKAQMNKAIQAVKKVDVSKLAVGALNLFQGGAAIALGAGLTAVCPPAGIGLVALGTGTALIGFGQAAEATVHEDPIRNFANNLGISNKAYDTASEAVPFLTSLGCMGATSMLQASALRSGASSAVDTVANMTEHATEAEERVISYETDAYSVYTKGSYNKAPKPNYGPLARDVAGDNRGAALKGSSTYDIVEVEISRRKYPESAKYIEDAIANGQPEVLTIDRAAKKLIVEHH